MTRSAGARTPNTARGFRAAVRSYKLADAFRLVLKLPATTIAPLTVVLLRKGGTSKPVAGLAGLGGFVLTLVILAVIIWWEGLHRERLGLVCSQCATDLVGKDIKEEHAREVLVLATGSCPGCTAQFFEPERT